MSGDKGFKIFTKILFVAAALFVFAIIGSFLLTYSYAHFDQGEQAAILSKYDAVGAVFYSNNKKNTDSIYQMSETISLLPENFSDVLMAKWKVIVADETPGYLNTGSEDIDSLCDWNSHIIFIKSQSDLTASRELFAYELGHCFDYELGSPSSSDAFSELLLLYKGVLFYENGESTPAEQPTPSVEDFFATIFKEYILSPDQLNEKAPDAYLLMDSVYAEAQNKVCISAEKEYNLDTQTILLSEYDAMGTTFYADSDQHYDGIYKMNAVLSSLPNSFSEVFQKEWKVVVADHLPSVFINLAAEAKGENLAAGLPADIAVAGYSDWRTRIIYIAPQDNPDDMRSVFIHELGHCFDYEFGSPSSSEEFYKIFLLYRDSFQDNDKLSPDGYATLSEQEFFATVLKEYILSPDHLKSEAPEAYIFIVSFFEDVTNNPDATTTLKYDLRSAFIMLKNKADSLVA